MTENQNYIPRQDCHYPRKMYLLKNVEPRPKTQQTPVTKQTLCCTPYRACLTSAQPLSAECLVGFESVNCYDGVNARRNLTVELGFVDPIHDPKYV